MNFFESEARVRMRCEGHTEVFTGTVDYYKDPNEKPEKISFTEKNIAEEMKTMLARFVDSKSIGPEDIERIDLVTGGDHGKGAFQMAAKIIIVLTEIAVQERAAK